jgi:hypothetical protein
MRKRGGLRAIGDLPRMSAPQLQAVHRELFGAEHPISNCQHLRRKIAWHMQATKDDGLPESVRQYAIAIRPASNRSRVSLDRSLTSLDISTSGRSSSSLAMRRRRSSRRIHRFASKTSSRRLTPNSQDLSLKTSRNRL